MEWIFQVKMTITTMRNNNVIKNNIILWHAVVRINKMVLKHNQQHQQNQITHKTTVALGEEELKRELSVNSR